MPVRKPKPKQKVEEVEVVEKITEETKEAKKPVAKKVDDKPTTLTVVNTKGEKLTVSAAYYAKYKERLTLV